MSTLREEVRRRWPHAVFDDALLAEAEARAGDAPADLYLALSAARRATWALETFERDVLRRVVARLARRHGLTDADEALQQVREQLLVPKDGLASYAGRGPLEAWVTVIAVRRVLAMRAAPESTEAEPAISGGLELALLRARYTTVFREALAKAVQGLERRERLLLRMHFVDGLSAEKIGAIFHAHRATATQWISAARAKLHQNVADEVQRAAGMSSSELMSIGRVLQRHTDFSLPRLLHGEPATP